MKIFKFLGIDIKLDPMVIPLIIMSIHYRYLYKLIFVIIIILIHEISHSMIATYYGIKINEIEIFPFGAVARTENPFELNPYKEIVIAIGGPISNFIMLFIGIVIEFHMNTHAEWMYFFIFSNLTIGLFNMLPILPLDGGRILRAYINTKTDFKKATQIVIKISKLIVIFMFFYGIYLSIQSFEKIYISGIAVFLYFKTNKEKEMIGYTFIYQIVVKKKQLLENGIMDVKYLTALEEVELKKVFKEFSSSKYHFITIINDKGRVLGNISECEILDAMIKYNSKMTLKMLIEILEK